MSNTVKKPTKKANYSTISKILAAAQNAGITLEGEITYESLAEFIEHEVELLEIRPLLLRSALLLRRLRATLFVRRFTTYCPTPTT